jgi:hypothetical protein
MAISCGGILCGVTVFVGFMVISELIESSVERSEISRDDDLENIVFTGEYSFVTKDAMATQGKGQIRTFSKRAGMPDVAITSLDIRLRHDSYEAEIGIHQGMLVSLDEDSMEFVGKGETSPFLFSLIDRNVHCEVEDVRLKFKRSPKVGSLECVGAISSSDCGFKIEVTMQQVNLRRLRRKIVNYSIVSNALTLALIKLYIDQIRLLDSNSNFSRIALGTVVIQSIADSLDSMMNFFIGLSTQFLFNIFIIIALFKFILFSFFEMRLIILAWRQINSNEINSLDPYDAAHMERVWIQTRMYLPLVVLLVMLIMYPNEAAIPVVIASQLFWVPQIIHDAMKGHRSPLTRQFVLGVSGCRLVLPLYMWGCPESIFNGEVIFRPPGGPGLAIFLVVVQGIQVGLVLTQQKYGPRWFVPWMCLPHVYNYYRKIEMDEEFGVPECVVCMSEIDLKTDRKNTVITPCGHLFHSQCLGEWMNLRQECPLCRRELPPIT